MLIDLILHPLISVYIHINLDYVRLIGVLGMYVVDSSDRFHFSKYFIVNGVIQLAGNRFSIFVTNHYSNGLAKHIKIVALATDILFTR